MDTIQITILRYLVMEESYRTATHYHNRKVLWGVDQGSKVS